MGAMDSRLLGARLEEICGANVADVYQFGGVWCLDIRLTTEGGAGFAKDQGIGAESALHPAIIAEGFPPIWAGLPRMARYSLI